MTKAAQALKAAWDSLSKTASNDTNFAEILKTQALANLQKSMTDNSEDEKSLQIQLLEMGITVIIGTALVGYFHWNSTKDIRNKLNQEVKEKKATFVLPLSSDLSRKQAFIKNLIDLLKKTVAVDSSEKKLCFADYAGLVELNQTDSTLYILMPSWFLDKSDSLIADRRPLKSMRRVIDAFLQEEVPEELAAIDAKYKDEWALTSWTKAWSSTYLDDIRAARFLEICMANLLSKARRPLDANDAPLSAKENIDFCRRLGIFVNDLLTSVEKENPSGAIKTEPTLLQNFKHNKDRLVSYIRDMEIETYALRNAYVQDHLNEFSLDDVVNSAHSMLETVNVHILNLIYKSPVSTRQLFHKASYLRDIFQKNPAIITCFKQVNPEFVEAMNPSISNVSGVYKKLISENLCINTPPTTVIDALILFFHMTAEDKTILIKDLLGKNKGTEKEFAEVLSYFNDKFIRPIAIISEKELKATQLPYDAVDIAVLTARRVLPMMTLVFRSCETDVDTERVQKIIKDQNLKSGNQQIEEINQKTVMPTNEGYCLQFNSFIKADRETLDALNNIVIHQFHLIEVVTLIDSVRNLLNSNRCMLQQKEVFDFVKKCIDKIKTEYTVLSEIDQMLATKTLGDEDMSRHLKGRIDRMTLDIDKRLDHLKSVTEDIKHVLNTPDFMQRQKEMFVAQVQVINRQYTQLYKEPTGLEHICPVDCSGSTSSIPISDIVSTNKIIGLSALVHHCYDSLSSMSRKGQKEIALRDLKNSIDSKQLFSHDEFKQALRDLARIVMTYTETGVSQALYAKSRSAVILIRAIQNPRLNAILSLSANIFDNVVINYSKLSDAELVNCFQGLQQKNKWPESANGLSTNAPKILSASLYMQVIGASLLAAGLIIVIIGTLGLTGVGIGLVGVPAIAATVAGGLNMLMGGALLACGFFCAGSKPSNRPAKETVLQTGV